MPKSLELKEKLLLEIIAVVERELQTTVAAAHEARDAATNEESKAENKYDTRGLEASYLAGAQAQRAVEIQKTLAYLKKQELRHFGEQSTIDTTALIELEIEDHEESQWYFLLPYQGGTRVEVEGLKVVVLSRQSPLARHLLGKRVGDAFEFARKGTVLEHVVIQVI